MNTNRAARAREYSPPERLFLQQFNAFCGYDLWRFVLAARAARPFNQFNQFVSVPLLLWPASHAESRAPHRPVSGGRSEQREYGLNGLNEHQRNRPLGSRLPADRAAV